ncbi:phosphatase PAP2 family protein [Kitasatospora camelliae]|uniref:Phosphatase PAP2 family protein n=1 Tax=Kitasatospora camelliae TaxID=3156397 RepID=A0AAU8JYW3_9ACTN
MPQSDASHELQRRNLLRCAALALGSAVFFFALLILVKTGWSPLRRLDHAWVEPLHGYARRHAAWTASLQTMADLGSPLTMRILLGLAALWLWSLGARVLACWAVAMAVVGWAVGQLGKEAVARPRPHFPDPVAVGGGYAFPSGHALASALTCAVLVLLVWSRATPAGRVVASTLAGLTVLAVGWTRVALGVHWPSDVLGGWLAAGLVLGGVTVTVELWRPGALLRDARRVDWRTRPRVQRVLVSEETPDHDRDQS